MNKFFIFETEDNTELAIKTDIESVISNSKVYVPFLKSITSVNNNKVIFYNKLLPNYIILEIENLSKEILSKLRSIKNLKNYLEESTLNGLEPALLEQDAIEQYIKEYKYKEIYRELDGELVLLAGPYTGKTCKIKTKYKDFYSIIINVKNTPEVKVPLWCLGKYLKDK